MIDEEVNGSGVDYLSNGKKPKKPIPLPRRSIRKQENNEESDESGGSGKSSGGRKLENLFTTRSSKTASEIVQEKKMMVKNEVQKLEKSVRSIISKRRSVHPKPPTKVTNSQYLRSNSLPDDNVFCNISFNSPLSNDNICSDQDSKELSDSDLSSNDESNGTSDLPPPYPPPNLPDEAVYDETTSISSSNEQCSYLPSGDSNSLYEDLSKYQTLSHKFDAENNTDIYSNLAEVPNKSDSWSYYDGVGSNNSRYEEISGENESDPFTSPCNANFEVLQPDNLSGCTFNEGLTASGRDKLTFSVVDQFDPLSERESVNSYDLMSEISDSFRSMWSDLAGDEARCNPFQNPVILSSLVEEESTCDVFQKTKEQNSCLIEGHYGKVRKREKQQEDIGKSTMDILNRYEVELPPSCAPPPVPPRRFDSVTGKTEETDKRRSSIIRWSSMKRVAKMVAENIENRTSWTPSNLLPDKRKTEKKAEAEDERDENNCIYMPVMLNHSGILFKTGGVHRWGVLSQRKLTLFANKDSPEVKETVAIDTVMSIKAVADNKISVEGVQVYCFEISCNSKSQPYIFGAPSASERHIWMRKLLESLTQNFPVKLMSDYTKAGLCYAKEGISSNWTPCSILLESRTLYVSPRNGVLIVSDLRKARYLTLQTNDQTCKSAKEKGPMLLIDMQDRTLYLQMDYVRETKAWESVVIAAALENGPSLSEQQLTKDDVPTIVDKCINFIHTHGSLSEGIYRRNGSNQAVTKLLAAFRSDAWAIQLTRHNYNEFDVSSVLKRFFRDLPEPLFVTAIHDTLRTIAETHTDTLEEKLVKYSAAMKKLPKINYVTAKRLIGHLYFIDKQKEKNLMSVDNLSAIWGPTLLHVQEGLSLDPNWSRMESSVLNDLITHFPTVFEIDKVELEREMKILEVLENYHSNSNQVPSKKRSGDLKIWIHLNSVNKEDCINISVSPQRISEEICKELCGKVSLPSHLVCLEEVICGGSLSRPLHHSERIFDTVLRWGYWDDVDRKDNCLVLKKNDVLQELDPFSRPPVIFCEELKFADQKSRFFKSYLFELAQAKLTCYKDKSCSVKIGEWRIEDIVWYVGHEPKRNPHARWSITFIEKDHKSPRSKEKPFFGNILCGTTEEQKMKLMAAMLSAQFPQGILPAPNLIE